MIEELGMDKLLNASSQAVIKSGPNRGFRFPEKNGNWSYVSGYCYEASQAEKSTNMKWAKSIVQFAIRVGCLESDGVVKFYLFKENPNV
jgi:hypothetical protein